MRFTGVCMFVVATLVVLVAFAPTQNQASRKIIQKIKKIAALSILLKPKKLLALPLPLPLPLPIPVIKTVKSEPWPMPSWPAPEPSWGGESGGW